MTVCGDKGWTNFLNLKDEKRKLFQNGSIDSFIFNTNGPLGNLDWIRVRHDCSGLGDKSSWYLKFIIIHDLQSRDKSYFICNKWLSLTHDDGSIDRTIPIATQLQKTQFKYLLLKQTKYKISDGHLWFSIFARPIQSSFTRLDRLTCCFVLMYLTMLMNILYYGVDKSTNTGGLNIGPFSLTLQQVFNNLHK